RMWFFGAGTLAHSAATTQLPLSGNTNAESDSSRRGEVKITSALAQGQTLTFDAATNLTTNTSRPSLATADLFAIGKQALPNYFYLMNYRGQAGKKAFVEAQFSTRRLAIRELAAASTARVDSPMFTRSIFSDGSPALYNAPYFDAGDSEKRNSMQAGANLTYFLAAPRAGSHRIKSGYEFFRTQHVGGNSQSSTGYVFETDYLAGTDGTSPRLDASNRFIPLWVPGQTLLETWLPARGAILNVDTQSAYIQDHWVIAPRWAVDAGVRYERVRTGATGAFTHVDARTPLPRLAVGYNLDDRGGRVIHATYGRYAARLDEILLGKNSSVGNPDVWQGVYVGPAGQGRSYTPGLDPANYLTLAGRFPTANVVVDPELSPPIAKEFTVSYGMDLSSRGFLEAAYVSRRWSRLVDDDVSIANGTTHVVRKGFDVGTFTDVIYRNSDADQQYDALEFQGRAIAGSLGTAGASYTLQLRNNGHGSAAADAPGATSALGDYPEIFTADRQDPDGHLLTYQRHRLRLWGTHDARLGQAGTVSLSAILRVESGTPYSLEAPNQPLTPIQSARLLAAGYPDQPSGQTIFFGNLGSQQFKGYGVVDLAVVYRAPFVTRLRPWAKFELYNALNNTKQIAWDTTIVPDQTGPVDALGLPTTYHAAPSFGKATSNRDFPAPFVGMAGGRTFRLALGLRF
ncbi:MAG TPA: TonB-dependent receptor, partial [Vicinamibacterales bacterium]